MELGYSGIAYNLSIRGIMSDSDRCTIHHFPLSSLLKLAPSLSTSIKFHRNLLRVPPDVPFRQYTRLTVTVDNIIHAAALNSGNPVLKTYDLVAVKPLNQAAFDQACKMLVDWTQGKNIIISSAAATANELRGPNDVANLSVLLGLSMEKAKAAISKNCRLAALCCTSVGTKY
ncbi:protein GAMETOPHYTE DEFECTIVE 1-like isoform X2 [Aristolochia californica]|uniref:protein GAMETOPHYTE DEFECTIVE 1-like isoform X2 n=1 Tax=Aristolochia californica TaxID=171875 RepID=UPI0035DDC7A8